MTVHVIYLKNANIQMNLFSAKEGRGPDSPLLPLHQHVVCAKLCLCTGGNDCIRCMAESCSERSRTSSIGETVAHWMLS